MAHPATAVLSGVDSKTRPTDDAHLHPPPSVPPHSVNKIKKWDEEWWKCDTPAPPTASSSSDDDDIQLTPLDEDFPESDHRTQRDLDAYLITMSMDDSGTCVLDFDTGTRGDVGGTYPHANPAAQI
jgi:hypothetical protein